MAKMKKRSYPASQPCPWCGKVCNSEAGLRGHLQMSGGDGVHPPYEESLAVVRGQNPDFGLVYRNNGENGQSDDEGAKVPNNVPSSGDGIEPTPAALRARRLFAEKLELDRKIQRLQRELGGNERQPDFLGLGISSLAPSSQDLLIGKLTGSQARESTMTEIMTAIGTLLNGVKGFYPQQDGLSNLKAVLELLGIDLKQIREPKRNFPTMSLKVGDVDMSFEASDQNVASVLGYMQHQEKLSAEKEKQKLLSDGLQSISRMVGDEKFLNSFKNGGSSVSRRLEDDAYYPCPGCGAPFPPNEVIPGAPLKCKSCGGEFVAEDVPEASKPRSKSKSKAPKAPPSEPPELLRCVECSQTIDVTGISDGEKVICPACNAELKVENPDKPIAALRPKEEPTNPRGSLV
jgi:DNA-directed RNA polymerase subunit RPC12/RpoP